MAKHTQYYLLRKQRFLPLFITQFMGAFNDNLFKGAITILVTFKYAQVLGINESTLLAITAGCFVLPLFLFSATAGVIADKYEKSGLIRKIKFIEILLMGIGSLAFWLDSYWVLLFILFLMGAQSSFFGPLKYSIIPYHLAKDEILGGNALIEAATFIAILLGTIGGAMLIRNDNGIIYIAGSVVIVALIGFSASFFIPSAHAEEPELHCSFNFIAQIFKLLNYCKTHDNLIKIILQISWFWFIGATFLALFPNVAKFYFNADEKLFTVFLLTFTIGVGIGALSCNKILQGKITTEHTAKALLLMALLIGSFYLLLYYFKTAPIYIFLVNLALIAMVAGFYIVPLYTKLQTTAHHSHKARVIACNNVVNAFFMVCSAIYIIVLSQLGLSIGAILLGLGVVNVGISVFFPKIVGHF